jgi:hypothetical protein
MSKGVYMVVPASGGWRVEQNGNHVSAVHTEREGAWAEGRRLARGAGGEVVLLGRDGKVRTKNSYDPLPPKR